VSLLSEIDIDTDFEFVVVVSIDIVRRLGYSFTALRCVS
jgi:hypothetical protein